MPFKLGSTDITKAYLGTMVVSKLMLGTILAFQAGPISRSVTGSQTTSAPTQTTSVKPAVRATGAQTMAAATQSTSVAVMPVAGRNASAVQMMNLATQTTLVKPTVAGTAAQTLSKPTQATSIATGGTAAMPAGAIGLWYMDTRQTSPREYVPNQMEIATPVSANLLQMGYGGANYPFITLTANQTDSKGATLAYRWQATGNWETFKDSEQASVPAGNYVCVMKCKSNTGLDQTFQILNAGGGGVATQVTAPASGAWTRLAVPFVFGSTTTVYPDIKNVGGAAIDLIVESIEVFAGTSDPGEQQYGGHFVMGTGLATKVPPYANGEYDLSTNGNTHTARAAFAANKSISAFTGFMAVKKTAANAYNAYPMVLTKFGNGEYGKLGLFPEYNSDTGFFFNSFTPIARSPLNNLTPFTNVITDVAGREYVVVGFRHDGTTGSVWFNGVHIYGQAATRAAISLRDLAMNGDTGTAANRKVNSLALYDSALTDAQMLQATNHLKARVLTNGLTLDTTPNHILFEGDSNTDGSALTGGTAGPYALLYKPNASAAFYGSMYGTNGHKLSDLVARQAHTVRTLQSAVDAGKTAIVTVLIGTNDGSLSLARTAAAQTTMLQNLCAAWRATGAKVVYITLQNRLDGNAAAGFDAWRQTINSNMIASVGTYIDAVVDTTGDPNIGQTNSPSNTTYFSDNVHFTPAGHALLESYLRPVLNALLAGAGAPAARVVTGAQTLSKPTQTSAVAVVQGTAPTMLSSPNQTATSGVPWSLDVQTSEPCNLSFVGAVDDSQFASGGVISGSVTFDYLNPTDNGLNNVYNFTLRITSIATGLFTDIPMTLTVLDGNLFDFALSNSTISADAANGTAVGTLTSSGSTYPTDFTLSNSTISADAANGTAVGSLS